MKKEKMKLICVTCGKEFVKRQRLQKNCSRVCSREYEEAYRKAYQKTDKYQAYKKAYYLRMSRIKQEMKK